MALVYANNHLAISLHRLFSKEKGNVFFSPFSISMSMAMTFCAAEGETEVEMRKALGYDRPGVTKEDIISAFQGLTSEIIGNTEFCKLNCANALLIQKGFDVKDGYKQILEKSFGALLLEANFRSDGKKAIKQINEWVKDKTNNMIKSLIESVSPLTVMILLNAVYFKGSWLQKFDKKSTYKRKFYNDGKKDKAKSVDMMRIKEPFKYIKKDTFEAVVLPYGGEKFAMLILLPTAIDGLEALENEMSPSFVQNLVEGMAKKKVILNLPRFSLSYSKCLITCFKQLGIHKLFTSDAELGGASDCPGMIVSKIVHKAVLEVNEEGSEAAAATAVVVTVRSIQIIPEVIVDHPFAFAIYDIKNQIILFMGRVEEL